MKLGKEIAAIFAVEIRKSMCTHVLAVPIDQSTVIRTRPLNSPVQIPVFREEVLVWCRQVHRNQVNGMNLAIAIYCGWLELRVGAVEIVDESRRRAFQKDRKSTRLNSSHVKISYAV